MKSISTILFLIGVAIVPYAAAEDTVTYKDETDGFELRYRTGWEVTEDYKPGTHLILNSPDGNMMLFVLSEVLESDRHPKSEDALVEWGKALYLRDDPTIIPGTVEVFREAWRPGVRVVLSRKSEDGGILDSEILTFSDFYNDPSHTRIWKIFALMKTEELTEAERKAWQVMKESVRVTRFSE